VGTPQNYPPIFSEDIVEFYTPESFESDNEEDGE